MIFPPGTILQQMYFKERLKTIKPGKFIDVGTGNGSYSKLLCEHAWQGVGFELSKESISNTENTTNGFLKNGQYKIFHDNWLHTDFNEKADLIFSSMVVEHLNEHDEYNYFKKCESLLNKHGKAILFVPASLLHWGIEDEIAGHYRRYTYDSVRLLMKKINWNITHMSGLTFPFSNILFPISEYLVKSHENKKLKLNAQERTIASGHRNVLFKTTFPHFFKLILNQYTMRPFHLLQKLNNQNQRSLVIYLECEPATRTPIEDNEHG